jgi:LysR family transcriptional regulator, regulator for metE and metH
MDLEIRHLRLVDAIAKEGGMTKAAGRLNLTQSALSHQLREIEDRLGTPLFLRLKKKMLLTEAGEKVLSSSQLVLDELRRTEESIHRMASGEEGILRISTQCNTCYHWLPSILKSFNERFPRVEVQIVVEATQRPIEALLEGKLDIAIVHRPLIEKRLSYHRLFQDELLVVTRPDHPLAIRPYVKAQDFTDESLIIYANLKEDALVFQKVLIPASVSPRNVIRVMLTEAIIEMVKAGIGITVLAKWAAAPYIRSGAVRGIRLTKKGLYREWLAAMLQSDSRPPYYMEFIKLLEKQVAPAFKSSVQRFKKAPAALELFPAAR